MFYKWYFGQIRDIFCILNTRKSVLSNNKRSYDSTEALLINSEQYTAVQYDPCYHRHRSGRQRKQIIATPFFGMFGKYAITVPVSDGNGRWETIVNAFLHERKQTRFHTIYDIFSKAYRTHRYGQNDIETRYVYYAVYVVSCNKCSANAVGLHMDR